jgi:hypothetical protein
MSNADQKWLEGGRGLPPEWTWSFTADAPLVGLELARETGETVVADAAGSVYLLDRRGRIVTLSRGLHTLSGIAWCDAGMTGAVIVGDSNLTVLNRQLRVVGTSDLRDPILTVAVDPFGRHFAVSLQTGETRILNAGRKTIARFTTTRPLSYTRFVTTETDLISAADNGLICRHHLDGSPVWGEPWWSNIGDLCISGDGRTIFLAGLNLGIQRFDEGGNSQGTYVLEGTPNRIAASFALKRLVASTVEKGLYWLDSDGEILWATTTPEEICSLRCDPLGTGIVCGFETGRVVRLDWGFPVA